MLARMPDLPSLELICLGPPTARVDGGDPNPDVMWRRHLGLLIYLALSPDGSRSREQVMGMLWPEKPRENARHSLNEAVRRCRASLGAGRILTERERITINREGLVVDAHRLQSLDETDAAGLVALLRGEFLEGFHIDNAQSFDEWAMVERGRLRDVGANACLASGGRALAQGDLASARALAGSALRVHPHSEAAVSLGMQAAALDHDSAAALSIFHAFAETLENDLGEKPSAALNELATRVRNAEWQRYSGKYKNLEPQLVGRAAVHDLLFADLTDGMGQGARCFAIVGDQGSGKSRLLTECVERLSLGGAHAAVVRLLETDHDTPWSTLRTLMRTGLGDAPGMAGVDTRALETLAGVVPELAERAAPAPSSDQTQVADALLAYVTAVTEETPLVVAVDEAQWADGATLAALQHVCSVGRKLPFIVVVTSGSTLAESPHLVALVERIDREYGGSTVHLEPFDADETEQLVRQEAPWCTEDGDRDRLARRVSLESGGNVFLSVMLLRDLEKTARLKDDMLEWPPEGSTYSAPLPFSIPSLARVALVARLSRLSDDANTVVRSASMTGALVNVDLIMHLTGFDRATVEGAIDELERQRLIGFTGNRYVFNGRLLPEIIRSECVRRGEQRRMRAQAIEFLESNPDVESQALRAELLGMIAQHEEALDSALGIVESAVEAGAFHTARRVLDTAERAVIESESDKQALVEEFRDRLAG